jgi:hypothetical protein
MSTWITACRRLHVPCRQPHDKPDCVCLIAAKASSVPCSRSPVTGCYRTAQTDARLRFRHPLAALRSEWAPTPPPAKLAIPRQQMLPQIGVKSHKSKFHTNHDAAARHCQTSRDRSHVALHGAVLQQTSTCPCRLNPCGGRDGQIQPSGIWTCHQAPVTLTPTRDVRLSARRPSYGAYGLPSYVFELMLMTLRTQRVQRLAMRSDPRLTGFLATDGCAQGNAVVRICGWASVLPPGKTPRSTCQRCCTRKRRLIGLRIQRERQRRGSRLTSHCAERIASHIAWFTETH